MEQQLKLAFVGCGVIFKHHLSAIASLPEPRRILVSCVIEPNEERRAAAVLAVAQALGATPESFASLAAAAQADPNQNLFTAVDIMVPSLGPLHETVGIEVGWGATLCVGL